ncbi:MAG TPA: hypothetical protein DD732_04035, partial [Rhizobiales bacterium]|nr:hypothetical protein [Hyphomicrobiales bacterium]
YKRQSLPGFKQTHAAEAWLAQRPAEAPKPVVANASTAQAPALPDSLSLSADQKEALFKHFIEWQRGKGR